MIRSTFARNDVKPTRQSTAWLIVITILAMTNRSVIADQRPNVLFILADDHTTQAISCYGGPLASYANTKNIDRLASQGVRLTHCFCNNSICSPSRASILTGQYSHQNGVYLLDQGLRDDSPTFPESFRAAGYQTFLFGKWHLVGRPKGFDDYKILPRQGRYQDPQFHTPGTDALQTIEGWSTDVITDLTIDAIRGRDPNRPFLTLCHYKATHDPWASREPQRSLWTEEDLPEPASLLDDYANRGQASQRTTLKLEQINQGTFPHERLENATDEAQRRYIYQQYIKSFLRCGRVLDENVGRLMKFLDEEGLAKNTIVIYTADQGHFLGEHGFFSKRFMYEESMRMPFIVRGPAVGSSKLIPAGVTNDDMISNVDFAPTVLTLAGIDVPEAMQGRSFAKNLIGQTPDDWPQAVYYHYWQHLLHRNVTAHYGIRTRDTKLIHFYGLPLGKTTYPATPPEWEMFDLQTDPQEMRNVIDDETYASRKSQMIEMLEDLRKSVGDSSKDYPAWQQLLPTATKDE